MAYPQTTRTQRVSYPALVCHDVEATLEFYSAVLGMEAIAWHPCPDEPSFTRVYLDAGAGAIIAFVGPSEPNRTVLARGRLGVGSMQHLALQLDGDGFEQAQRELRARDLPYTGPIDRGFERVLYVRDPNGISLELTDWLTPLPAGADPALVLKTAHRLCQTDGAVGLEDHHIQQALVSLYGGIGSVPVALG